MRVLRSPWSWSLVKRRKVLVVPGGVGGLDWAIGVVFLEEVGSIERKERWPNHNEKVIWTELGGRHSNSREGESPSRGYNVDEVERPGVKGYETREGWGWVFLRGEVERENKVASGKEWTRMRSLTDVSKQTVGGVGVVGWGLWGGDGGGGVG
ncbi:hypothetical protein Tco_0407509 [Tanacetum coccineum]